MKDTKISIIVPVYNVEQYLEKCLDSLVNQTMKEIEIIVVNDASPDNSKEIMERYAKAYPEMVRCVYHEVNLGLGGARNTGVNCANGKYVLFVDSDDYIDVTTCEKLYKVAVENDSDIVSCEILEGLEGNFKEIDPYSTQVTGDLDYEKRRLLMSVHFVGACAKLVRRNMLIENELLFPEKMKYEDTATVPLWWVYTKRFHKIQEGLYYYVRRDGSITKTKNSDGYYDMFKAAKYVCQRFEDKGLSEEYQECIDNLLLRGLIEEIKLLIKNVDVPNEKELQELKKDIQLLIPDYEKNPLFYMGEEPKAIVGAQLLMQSVDEFCDVLSQQQLNKLAFDYKRYYENGKERWAVLWNYCEERNYKIAVWGAGIKGKDFLQVCDSSAEQISQVIDKNEKNWNRKLSTGHVIRGFQDVCNQVDVVLVMNKVYFGAIYREVKAIHPEIKLVNLDLVLMTEKVADIEEYFE